MVRTYKRIIGKNSRAVIDADALRKAIEDVKKGMSLRDAQKKHNVNYSSISKRMRNPDIGHRVGAQTALSPELESAICDRLITCANWGYPVNMFEVQKIISDYLQNAGITIARFNNNVPGPDYLRAFLKRHKEQLSYRLCNNIKRSRAAISAAVVSEYFEELSTSLRGVPPQNIFNYDETNITDDPGSKKGAL